jgi:hypothetical protein
MQQALIANSFRHGVNQITPNELKTHGAILNILKQTAASIGGGIVLGRVVDLRHEYDGKHVLSPDAFAALITHEPDLKTQYKLMENINSDIQLMKTKSLLAEAKAEEQMIARRARTAAAPDVPVRPPSPASLAAGQGQRGEGGTESDPMGFDSPQDHELADAYREAMRAREGHTARRSALPADDRLDDQAMIIHKLEMQVSMAKDMSTLPDKYYGCQDTDEMLSYIYTNSLLTFSSRLLSLLTAPAFQLVAEALGHKYKESLAPTGEKHKLEHILQKIKDIQGPVTLSTVRALRAGT